MVITKWRANDIPKCWWTFYRNHSRKFRSIFTKFIVLLMICGIGTHSQTHFAFDGISQIDYPLKPLKVAWLLVDYVLRYPWCEREPSILLSCCHTAKYRTSMTVLAFVPDRNFNSAYIMHCHIKRCCNQGRWTFVPVTGKFIFH